MRLLSDKEYERMERNGWYLVSFDGFESPAQSDKKARLKARYNTIKVYYRTTRVRGYYRILWACKNVYK